MFVQVPQCPVAKAIPPALPTMLGGIVKNVAPLAQRSEICRRVVTRVMIEMCTGQHHPRDPYLRQRYPRNGNPPTGARPPASTGRIPPTPVSQMRHALQMRAAATFATATGSVEPDRSRQLRPVDRIEPAIFRTDRHADSMSRPGKKRKRKPARPTETYNRSKSIVPNRSSVASAGGRGYFRPVAQLNSTTSSSASTSPSRNAWR